MTDKVVDASALAAILFLEPGHEAVEEALSGSELYAPTLIRFELANVCLKKIKMRPAERDAILEAFASFVDFGVREKDIDFEEAIRLAEAAQLSIYDASYLWLAEEMSIKLITLDKRLAAAAYAT